MFDQAYKLREYYKSNAVERRNRQQIISVTSGKGGTGKSFVAFYIAQLLAEQGHKTLLVEFDFNLASLTYHLGINPDNTLFDFFDGKILFEELPQKIFENFHVAFGDNGRLNYTDNNIAGIRNFFNSLFSKGSEYDFVIIDNGAGISHEIFEALKFSTFNLLVTLPDHVAVMDAYVVVKLMKKNSIDISNGVIVNKCKSISEGKLAFENLNKAVTHFLKTELNLMGILSEDQHLKEPKILNQTSINRTEIHEIISEISSAALSIATFGQMANNHQPAS